jgi:2-succinyl-5-enolpyruvyl-6-hydroxy-3-cyclohexene-1-carboxylate synthase
MSASVPSPAEPASGPMSALLKSENINYFWADLLLEELARQARGLPLVIICPGSRSSPLAIAATRTDERSEYMIVTDERCAGFIALGAAAVGREPIIITTSGTAVANLLPAVVEASISGRSIIVLTADRPAELHACGANQTIPQRGLFGEFVRWSFELPVPDDAIDPAFVLSTAAEARSRARLPHPGPVHLNVPFREPLAPRAVPFRGSDDPRLTAWARDTDRVWRRLPRPAPRTMSPDDLAASGLTNASRGAIVAGAGADAAAVASLARAIRWPIIADVATGLRGAAHADVTVAVPDLVLAGANDSLAAALRPDAVLRIGGPISSKRVNAYVASAPHLVVLRDGPTRFDETHRAAVELSGSVESLIAFASDWQPSALCERWIHIGRVAERAVDEALADDADGSSSSLTEPWLARALLRAHPPGRSILLGNSMPIRDADMHFPSAAPALQIVVNRGASGIDGLVSTGVGVASAGAPTTVFLGDLSLLHDCGGLANVHKPGAPVHIVVVNNDGGGIFHFLPIASESGGGRSVRTGLRHAARSRLRARRRDVRPRLPAADLA